MSQTARILIRLRQTPGEWVPMPELARIGSGKPNGFCMVHSRIADLRRAGYEIEQGHDTTPSESKYRLLAPLEQGALL